MKLAITGKRRITAEQGRLTARFLTALGEALPGASFTVNERYRPVLEGVIDLRALGWREEPTLHGADLALSIGGDGTFLRSARWIGGHETPILGINNGHLGYLTDVTLEAAPEIVGAIAALDFDVEPRSLVAVTLRGDGERSISYPFALNEVAVLRDDSASMIEVETVLDGLPLTTYQADGLIVATPTGSTGYNLSVGGPILAPASASRVLSPVAAHALTMRPLVVPDTSVIDIRVASRSGHYRLALDGRSVLLPQSVTLRLERAPFVTRVALRRGHNFAATLRNKLLWGIDGRSED